MCSRVMFTGVLLLSAYSSCLFARTASYDGRGYKIAVIDSGIMKDWNISRFRIDDQLCWSKKEKLTDDSMRSPLRDNQRPPASENGWFDYEIASTCKNGQVTDITAFTSGISITSADKDSHLKDFQLGFSPAFEIKIIIQNTPKHIRHIAVQTRSMH